MFRCGEPRLEQRDYRSRGRRVASLSKKLLGSLLVEQNHPEKRFSPASLPVWQACFGLPLFVVRG
jgi:hypothetical protein